MEKIAPIAILQIEALLKYILNDHANEEIRKIYFILLWYKYHSGYYHKYFLSSQEILIEYNAPCTEIVCLASRSVYFMYNHFIEAHSIKMANSKAFNTGRGMSSL